MKARTQERVNGESMLNWIKDMVSFPYKLSIGGPDANGNSCRGKGSEWYVSYDRIDGIKGFDGCVYAPTREAAIQKAMNLHATQKKVERMLAQAKA